MTSVDALIQDTYAQKSKRYNLEALDNLDNESLPKTRPQIKPLEIMG